MIIEDLLKKYLEFCSLYRKPATFIAYQKSFKLLLSVLDLLKISKSDQLTQESYNQIIHYFKNNTIKKNSKINSMMSDFKTALNYSRINYQFVFYKLVDDTTHYKSLNDTELDLLLKYLKSLDLKKSNNLNCIAILCLMLDSGVRKSEALNIASEDVDFTSKLIYLNITKNKKRVVKFGALSTYYLNKIFNIKNQYLFTNVYTKNQLKRNTLEKFLIKLNKNLNFDSGNVHPHRLRKTFATQLLKHGCPLTTIQLLLGHSDIKMTMIYLDIDSLMVEKDYIKHYPY